jgi:hypothetical protein
MTLTKEQIEKAIALSRAFNDALPASPEGPVSARALLNTPDNIESFPEFQALKAFLHALSEVELRELQAIMFIGRGDSRVGSNLGPCWANWSVSVAHGCWEGSLNRPHPLLFRFDAS